MPDRMFQDGEISNLDYDYQLLQEVAELLDSKLDDLLREASDCPDPDAFGIWDRMEFVAGFGFVACQAYVTRVCGAQGRKDKLALGSKGGRYSVAQVIDAAANYWKHHSEWADPPESRAQKTIEVLIAIGVDPASSYPVFQVLQHLQGDFPKRFSSIAPRLASWRDQVLAGGS